MKLPKCEHCGKLMVGHLAKSHVVSGPDGFGQLDYEIIYLCPERIATMDPIWVEVHESNEGKA